MFANRGISQKHTPLAAAPVFPEIGDATEEEQPDENRCWTVASQGERNPERIAISQSSVARNELPWAGAINLEFTLEGLNRRPRIASHHGAIVGENSTHSGLMRHLG
jgi:hypothetical protein